MTSVPLAALLAGAAGAVLLAQPGDARLRRVLPRPHRPQRDVGGAAGTRRPPPVRGGRRAPHVACALAGVALVLLLPWPFGLPAGAAAAALGPRALARLEPGRARARREQLLADLPLALDLLAACLAGGAPLPVAAGAVGAAVPGPAGARLAAVAGALRVGAPPGEAWAALAGPDPELDPLAPAARALARAADGGAPVAAAVARLAADARRERQAAGTRAAHRAGVLAVAPLGLCFLPAFVLLGIVPVVAGLAGPLLAVA